MSIHSTTTTATLGILTLWFSKLRLGQVDNFISASLRTFTSTRLLTFLQLNADSLYILDDVNRIYGHALLVYLLIGLPSNAILVMLLLFQPLTVPTATILATVALLQSLILFGIHLSAALIIGLLHKPVKKLSQVSIHSPMIKEHLYLHLKLASYLEQFTPNNAYLSKSTVKYGTFGSITYSSFGKVRKWQHN